MILTAEGITFTNTIPWLIALSGVIVAIYFGVKNLKLAREKNQREKRKHEKDENQEAKEGFKLKTDLDKYKKGIYDRFKEIDFTGLNAYQKKLPLERVYVRLKAKENYRLEDYRSIYDFEKLKEEISGKENKKIASKSFSDVFTKLANKAENQNRALKMLLLGHPGSGKTTLFKWIALQCVTTKKNQHQATFSKYIPFFISLKDFAKNKDWLKQSLSQLAFTYFESRDLNMSFFKDRFERSEIIFLLDGLDEVADENLRREVIEWIEKQHIRNNKLLVSSRFSGLNPQKGLLFNGDFRAFMIEDLDETDIEQFLYRWYEAIETVVEDSEANRKEAQRQAGELVEVIKNPEYKALRNIAVNPLLLTIVAIVHRNRAKLPKERHKLYDECLNVMIELWHIVHKRSNVFFPAEVCKNNLGKLACHAMKQNKREFSYEDIVELLPGEIEGKPLDYFINEMVLKSGLLYESEGKYGFLHLTFQEYLTAYSFAQSNVPLNILEYRDRDYWKETIKLFVNLGNKQQFFEEIIQGLDEKYWQQMDLWESCLRDEIIDENLKSNVEIRLAKKVCNILLELPFEDNEEIKIFKLFRHYPLYLHADSIDAKGWELMERAKHPFVRSIGASILINCNDSIKSELINILLFKLKETCKDDIDMFMEVSNSVNILLNSREKITDFKKVVTFLKSDNSGVVFLVLLEFFIVLRLTKFINYYPLIKDLELQELNNLIDVSEYVNSIYLWVFRHTININTVKLTHWDLYQGFTLLMVLIAYSFKASKIDVQQKPKSKKTLDIQFLHKVHLDYQRIYRSKIQTSNTLIQGWANRYIKKLHELKDDKIAEYFPNTTQDELLEFRANNTLEILQELKQEKYHVLVNHLLTIDSLDQINSTIDKENAPGTFYKILIGALKNKFKDNNLQIYKKRVLSWLIENNMLQNDEETIMFLLSFDLNPNNPENQKVEMEAMKFLHKKEYNKWRELVASATQERDDGDDRWVNALYFFKELN